MPARRVQLAHWAAGRGLQCGDTIALFMSNCPEFIITWLAMAKLGVISAFINHNLRGAPLLHCVRVSNAKLVIFDAPLAEQVDTVRGELEAASIGTAVYGRPTGNVEDIVIVPEVLVGLPSTLPPRVMRAGISLTDTFAYVYTSGVGGGSSSGGGGSAPARWWQRQRTHTPLARARARAGTTGMPKAAVITHYRMLMAGLGFSTMFGVGHGDIIYTVLPLYHSAGGMIGTGMMLFQGATLVVRNRCA